ncbi:MAG: DNA starvation/stationary phase protection protein [Rhizobacter sp.]|nr:DNA starvation/stationary phase protection protein [Chlorobiales bacterium]
MSTEVKVKNTSAEVISSLSRELSSTYLLSIKYKKFHWYVSGPFFRELHLMFDEHHTQLLAVIDDLAERSRVIGGYPAATAEEFIAHAEIKESKNQTYTPQEMVEILYADTDTIINALHRDVELATKDNDPGTADLLTGIVQVYQKQAWFLAETKARKALV